MRFDVRTETADETRAVGASLAHLLKAGDMVILVGDLGAGKTTLVQGLGAALGVRGRVTSPTYIVSRVHRSQEAGPDLIHVDAYRVEDDLDMETVDLEASLEDSVTVVEWGQGKVDSLSADRFELTLQFDGEDEDARKISLVALGEEPERRLAEWVQTRPLG